MPLTREPAIRLKLYYRLMLSQASTDELEGRECEASKKRKVLSLGGKEMPFFGPENRSRLGRSVLGYRSHAFADRGWYTEG